MCLSSRWPIPLIGKAAEYMQNESWGYRELAQGVIPGGWVSRFDPLIEPINPFF